MLRAALSLFWILVAVSPVRAVDEPALARNILDATGCHGGLVVHLGCGSGRLTAALRGNDRYLVHGLDTDPESVQEARQYIQSSGMYGAVSVERLDGAQLPYADDLVNLLVAERLVDISKEEVMRVLTPGGVAYIREGGNWEKTVKPWPAALDEWTHYLHDASNNAVARDTRVGPPRRLQWVCGPFWSRSHEFSSSLCAMVSASGRVFYIFDEGLTGVTPRSIPEKWMLIARDAFNGVLLWKRPIQRWGPQYWKKRALRSNPSTVPRRLVAAGDRLFVTLGYDAPLSALDAATGKVLTTYTGTEGTEEIRHIDGILLLRLEAQGVLAIDATSGKRLWESAGNIQRLTLAADDGRVFFRKGQALVCVRAADGEEQWRKEGKGSVSLLVAHKGRVLVGGRQELRALSAESGATLWTSKKPVTRGELFAARGKVWNWEGERIVGLDLDTGERASTVDPREVFTPGHHFRCYPTKGTENFLITPNRGVEFVDLTGETHTQSDWLRGPCTFGILPCNGLLYVPPDPCFCYPGVKLSGFHALAPAARAGGKSGGEPPQNRLEKGKAYSQAKALAAPRQTGPADWPTYRHDARRTGASANEVPAGVTRKWSVPLQGRITPPVVAGHRVYVAAKDAQTLHALHVEDGRALWTFIAGGRIDSPPGILGKLVLFGCADGHVYCLRATDGELVWRLRAAPSSRRIVSFGRLESPWRVHGSVLLRDGVAYCTAGRSSYLDGGIRVLGLDPTTGAVLHETVIDTWARTRTDAEGKPFIAGYHMEGTHSDILVSEGEGIYLGQMRLDRELEVQEIPYTLPASEGEPVAMDLSKEAYVEDDEKPNADYEDHQRKWLERTQKELLERLQREHGGYNLGDRKIGRHVFSTAGFLDDSWYNRTYWMYSETWPGFYLAHRASKTGQLLVVGPEKTYAVQAYPSRNLQSPLFTPGEKGYLLFADRNDNEPVLDHRTRGTTKGWGFTRSEPPVWHDWVPIRIRAMVLAGERLFVAGPPDVVDPDDPMASFEGRKGAVLRVCSAIDGKMLAERKLEAPPVFDGLIAAAGRLFLSTTDGDVLCLGPGDGSKGSSE